MARIKTVFTNAELPHQWAHGLSTDGRTSNGNMFIEGKSIFSYGHHFEIARWVENERGERAVLFNSEGYSNTTSQHKSGVRRSISDEVPVFEISLGRVTSHYGSKIDHERVMKEFATEVTDLIGKVKRARSNKEWKGDALAARVQMANEYAAFFGLSNTFSVEGVDLEALAKSVEEWKAGEAERERVRQAEKERKNAEIIERWLAGESVSIPYTIHRAYLRVKGDIVETSLGADFPISHAAKGYALVKRILATGKAYIHSGHSLHLGHYVIDRIDTDGTVKAGCHTVKFEDIERIAPALVAVTA